MKPVTVFTFLVCLLVPICFLSATSYVMTTDETLVRQADFIVIGKVLSRSTRMSSYDRPETVYRVQVEQLLKGRRSVGTVNVTVPGGTVGNVGLRIYGMPGFLVSTPG